ncbi:MAG: hypothetical protein QM820_10065 [Minicystis sp.]
MSVQAGVVAVVAQIRFKATLADASGGRRVAGTVTSKKPAVSRNDISDNVASAVESMYEGIAQELFADAAPAGKK